MSAQARLSGPEQLELREVLREAFSRDDFEELLLFRLDRRLSDLAGPNEPYPAALRRVLDDAVRKLWWRDLVAKARDAVPGDPDLLAFAERFALAPITLAHDGPSKEPVSGRQLELKIIAAQSSFDLAIWRRRLGEIEGRVCRIEYPAWRGRGTGFLVAENLVLTNQHVVARILEGEFEPGDVVLRFDFKVEADGSGIAPSTAHSLAEDWLEDVSPPSPLDKETAPGKDPEPDQLDYALLRVDGTPGAEPVGGAAPEGPHTLRGWIELPGGKAHDFASKPALYIVQHPDGRPMEIALDTNGVLALNGNGTRVRYTTTTEPGSSGSPCFGPDWELVAMHHSGDPKYWEGQPPEYNQGIPVPAIRALLEARGKLDLLGG